MNRIATVGFAALLALPAIGCAQERKDGNAAPHAGPDRSRQLSQADDRQGQPEWAPQGKSTRRLESVTWNSVKHELTWVISRGEKKDGATYSPNAEDKYEINMDDATMLFKGERRGFSKEEASNVHLLMDLIAKYAIDSTIWWDQGQGQKLDGNGNPEPTPSKPVDSNGKRTAVLHISGPARDLANRELDARIRLLEQQLRELKRIQRLAAADRLTLTAH